MRKFMMYLLMLTGAMCLMPVMVFATDGSPTFAIGLQEYVATFSAFAATVILVTSFINTHFFKWGGHKKQYLSWGIAAIIGVAAYFLELGIFFAPAWHIPIYVFSFVLGANGLFDWELIRSILRALKLEK